MDYESNPPIRVESGPDTLESRSQDQPSLIRQVLCLRKRDRIGFNRLSLNDTKP